MLSLLRTPMFFVCLICCRRVLCQHPCRLSRGSKRLTRTRSSSHFTVLLLSASDTVEYITILFSPKNATTNLDQGYGAFGVIGTTGAIAIIYTFDDNPDYAQNNDGTRKGSQDYWANFSYTLG